MATITRLKGVEQNKEFDRVLVRQLNFRTGSNNPIPANQVLFSDGSGGTYWADPSGSYSCRAFNIFRVGTNGTYYSTVATGASNILKLESGYGIGMYKSDIPDSDSFYIYNTGPSRIQTQAGSIEFSTLSTSVNGRILKFVGLGNSIVTASTDTIFFESGGNISNFSTINADYVSTSNLTFSTAFGSELTLSTLNISSINLPPLNVSSATSFSGSSIQTSSIFATDLDTSTLRFSTGIGNNLSVSSFETSTLNSLYASFVSSFANSMVISSLTVSSSNISSASVFTGSSIQTSSIFATNLDTSSLSFSSAVGNKLTLSCLIVSSIFALTTSVSSLTYSSGVSFYTQTENLSTNNLSTNNLLAKVGNISSLSTNYFIGVYGEISTLNTNSISTNAIIGAFGSFSSLSTQTIETNSISSLYASFISSFADSMVISSLVVSSINISTAIPIGSSIQISTMNGFSSPIINMVWENGYVGINLGESTPQTALDVNGIIYAQNVVTYSDYRLKEKFEYANFDLDLLTNLRAQRFEWKKDHSKDFGLIAQQVESILPECVETDMNGYKLVSYQKLVPVAFDLIHNLACKVSTLESIVNERT